MRSLYRLDPEIAAALAPLAAKAADAPPIERGDWRALRERANANLTFLGTLNPPVSAAVQVQRLRTRNNTSWGCDELWPDFPSRKPASLFLTRTSANGEPFMIAKAGKPLVKVVALGAPEAGQVKRVGFLTGQISVPDFDQMGDD